MTPKVSTAMGLTRYQASMFAHFSSLREAASFASAPASWAALVTWISQWTSQHNDLPLYQEMNVRPSGHLLSVRNNPAGSLVTGTPADEKPRAAKSFRAWCLACDWPGVFLQMRLWIPQVSVWEPQWQWWGRKKYNPNLRPIATNYH